MKDTFKSAVKKASAKTVAFSLFAISAVLVKSGDYEGGAILGLFGFGLLTYDYYKR